MLVCDIKVGAKLCCNIQSLSKNGVAPKTKQGSSLQWHHEVSSCILEHIACKSAAPRQSAYPNGLGDLFPQLRHVALVGRLRFYTVI